jgi:hypothetical protein
MVAGPVFWLPGHPARRAFPSKKTVAFVRGRSPVTAAGPQRFFTAFPHPSRDVSLHDLKNTGVRDKYQEKSYGIDSPCGQDTIFHEYPL